MCVCVCETHPPAACQPAHIQKHFMEGAESPSAYGLFTFGEVVSRSESVNSSDETTKTEVFSPTVQEQAHHKEDNAKAPRIIDGGDATQARATTSPTLTNYQHIQNLGFVHRSGRS